KVLDAGIRNLLNERLQEYGGNAQKAFSNLDDNPIWLNKEAGIAVKRVVIEENVPAVAIRNKRDHAGNVMKDADGNSLPADYVNLRNNHHIAIYRDAEGDLQEKVVSFFEAMDRVSNGLKPVDKDYRKTEGWKFLFSMKINEMFVLPNPQTGFDPAEIDLTDQKNYGRISPNLYRVQKLSKKDYYFRHHLETSIEDTKELQEITWKRIRNLDNLKGAVKVRINHIGEIVAVGEYD
ncbi:MAG: type II CRISPR RNA-guided endonuclease Cas9, partial [Bacteroidales bacterium]|nr:type II CRISPR RNA-guided endonuclease Cas9 [Bacteroidales bacterium]